MGLTDIADPALYRAEVPEREWKALRAVGRPVLFAGDPAHWAVTRHQQVDEVYRRASSFSSEHGMHLGAPGSRATIAARAAAGKCLLVTDDPVHAAIRRSVAAWFTPRALQRLSSSAHETAASLVASALAAGETDFVPHVGAPLPSILICDLVGVPERDRSYVMVLTQDAFGDAEEADADRQVSANAELFAYCDELVTSKRRRPGDDVATALAQGEVAGQPMSHETAVLNCHDLFAAGNETARHTSAAALLTMMTHPGEWTGLRAGAVSFESATEELLRYEASVSHVMRVALEDVEVGGVTIRAGEFVTLWLRSANRDELVFDRPDDLIFSRSPNNHVTFGRGAHFCLGSHLARMEIASLLHALVELVATVELVGEPVRLASSFLRGFSSLPVRLHGR